MGGYNCPPFFIMIKINNKEYKFKLGFKALLMLEETTGVSASELGQNIKMGMLVDLCYCGIKSTGEEITKEDIIDAIDADMGLLSVITKAMEKDMAAISSFDAEAGK